MLWYDNLPNWANITLMVIDYLLLSFGLYTMARSRKFKNAWISFVPVIQYYTFGKIGDDINFNTKHKRTHYGGGRRSDDDAAGHCDCGHCIGGAAHLLRLSGIHPVYGQIPRCICNSFGVDSLRARRLHIFAAQEQTHGHNGLTILTIHTRSEDYGS